MESKTSVSHTMHNPTFIAYAHEPKSRRIAKELALRLRRDGFSVWLDQLELKPGEKWEPAIKSALQDAQVMLVVISEPQNSQGWFEKEIEAAIQQGKTIIPILSEEADFTDIPEQIRDRQAVISPTQDNQAYHQLLWALGQSKPQLDDLDSLPLWKRIRSYVINK